jgi:hypothetical protein
MSNRTTLATSEIAALKKQYPELPAEYFDYLLNVGWGEADSGRIIYSGPVTPASIFGDRYRNSTIILFGDDMQGYCFGFDMATKRLGEISDFGEWEPWETERSFYDYVRGWA